MAKGYPFRAKRPNRKVISPNEYRLLALCQIAIKTGQSLDEIERFSRSLDNQAFARWDGKVSMRPRYIKSSEVL